MLRIDTAVQLTVHCYYHVLGYKSEGGTGDAVKGGVKPGHCGGAKVGQLMGAKVSGYSGVKGLWSVAEEALHP
jgi:hypothetical protein